MKKTNFPNYKRIYKDILSKKYPEKEKKCKYILEKEEISVLDIIKINEIIFGINDKEEFINNQKHRSYDQSAVIEILNYQKKNNLNNSQLATHFKLSRNTIAKWRKNFTV